MTDAATFSTAYLFLCMILFNLYFYFKAKGLKKYKRHPLIKMTKYRIQLLELRLMRTERAILYPFG